MALSNKQIEALYALRDEISIQVDTCMFHRNVMNALSLKGYVRISTYQNGDFWELTYEGMELFQ